jgi:SAM-dependent methyltransferase
MKPMEAKYIIGFVCHYVRKYTNASSVVLDIGCGRGQYAACTHGRYIGIDITAEQYSQDSPRRVDVLASAERLPFSGASVDFVMAVGSFYQVPHPMKALSEFHRVLQPQGRILLVDYNKRTQERLRVSEAQPRPCWTHKELLHTIEAAGFSQCERLLPYSTQIPRLFHGLAFSILERLGIWAVVTGVKGDGNGG